MMTATSGIQMRRNTGEKSVSEMVACGRVRACSSSFSPASADVVKVGLIADFTGAFATWGSQFQQAIEAYQALNGKTRQGA